MMIISFRHYPAFGHPDDSYHDAHSPFSRDNDIPTTAMSSSSSIGRTKINKPLIVVVVVASSIILGGYWSYSWTNNGSYHATCDQESSSAYLLISDHDNAKTLVIVDRHPPIDVRIDRHPW